MPLTITPKAGTSSSGTSASTPSFTAAANSVLVAVVSGSAGTGMNVPHGISGGSLTWVRLGGRTESELRVDLFYALTGAGGTFAATFTASSSMSRMACHIIQVSGNVDLTNPIGLWRIVDTAADGAVSFDLDPTGAAAAIQDGAAVIAGWAGSQTGAPSTTPGTGWTEAYDQTPGTDWGHQQTQYRLASGGMTQVSWNDVSTATDNFGSTGVAVEVRASDGGDGYKLTVGSTPTLFDVGASASGTGTVSPPLPPAIAANDIIIAVYETANEAVPATTGYADVRAPSGSGTAGGTTATRLTMRWKKAASSSDTAPPAVDGGDHTIARCYVFRGCDPIDPIGASNSNTSSSTTAVTMPSLVPERNNSLIFGGVSNATDTATGQISSWTNAALTTLQDQGGSQAIDGNGGGFDLFTGVRAAAGSAGGTTATLTTGSIQSRMHLALQAPWVKTFIAGVSGDVTGSLAATESGSDTAAITGAIGVTGSLAGTEAGNDVAAIAGAVVVAGALSGVETGGDVGAFLASIGITGSVAGVEAPDTTTITISVANPVTGTLVATEAAADQSAIVGSINVSGALGATESGIDLAAISAAVGVNVTLAAVEAVKDAASASGLVIVAGTLGATEVGPDITAITGVVGITGLLAATEVGSDSSSISGTINVAGTLSATEASDVANIIGGTGPPGVSGGLGATETGADIAAITGLVVVSGTLSATEAQDILAAVGSIQITGTLVATESGSDVAAVLGAIGVSGSLAATETGADIAVITGTTGANIAGSLVATETGSDAAQIAGFITVAGGLVGVEAPDVAAVSGLVMYPSTPVEVGQDVVVINGLVLIAGSLAAQEATDIASIVGFLQGALDSVVNLKGSIDDLTVLRGDIDDLIALRGAFDDNMVLRGSIEYLPVTLRGDIREVTTLRGDLGLRETA